MSDERFDELGHQIADGFSLFCTHERLGINRGFSVSSWVVGAASL